MKTLPAILSSLLLATAAAHADNSQQDRMKDCNVQAKTQALSGDARKSFMKTCLSNKPAADDSKLNSQQLKMKQCNADAKAKSLAAADRKTFMSNCLKGS
ncbi:MAG TPA: PsiF family protein [Steroidobacteraceae bacterium]|jgi:predicted lysophospholipase L1 biosynthesis ABC-type transport system permease subunit